MTKYKDKIKSTPIVVSVYREGDNPIFGETATHICIDDDAAGPFVVLKQRYDNTELGTVRLDIEELQIIIEQSKKMLEGYQDER